MQDQVLVRCGEVWCDWQADNCVSSCPYRGGVGFRHAYCKMYSTPGPHSESKIAKVLGESMAKVKDAIGRAERKLKRDLADEEPGGRHLDETRAQEVA